MNSNYAPVPKVLSHLPKTPTVWTVKNADLGADWLKDEEAEKQLNEAYLKKTKKAFRDVYFLPEDKRLTALERQVLRQFLRFGVKPCVLTGRLRQYFHVKYPLTAPHYTYRFLNNTTKHPDTDLLLSVKAWQLDGFVIYSTDAYLPQITLNLADGEFSMWYFSGQRQKLRPDVFALLKQVVLYQTTPDHKLLPQFGQQLHLALADPVTFNRQLTALNDANRKLCLLGKI